MTLTACSQTFAAFREGFGDVLAMCGAFLIPHFCEEKTHNTALGIMQGKMESSCQLYLKCWKRRRSALLSQPGYTTC
jgi:hypothetical protein